MNLHRLNVFITAAQYMSFTEAAKHLYIAQSAVSHDIAELEKELDTKLFTRTRTGISFTPAGEIFFSEACKIMSIAQSAKQKIKNIAEGEAGDLRLGFVAEQMIEPLVPFLKRYLERHPSVDLHFNAYNSIVLSRHILNGDIDFSLGRKESLARRDDIEWWSLYRDPFYVALPATHRFASEKEITIDMIKDETIILMSNESNPGFFGLVQKFFLSHGVAPLLNTTSNDRVATIMMMRIGMGLTILTKQFLNVYDFDDIACIPLTGDGAFHEIGIAWRRGTTNELAELFLRELREYSAGNPFAV